MYAIHYTGSVSFGETKVLSIKHKANLEMYKSVVSKTLADINLPLDALLCKDSDCQSHTDMLNLYYTSIVHGLNTSATCTVCSICKGWTAEILVDSRT